MTEIELSWEIMLAAILVIGGAFVLFAKKTPGPLFRAVGLVVCLAGVFIAYPLLVGVEEPLPLPTIITGETDIVTQAISAFNATSMAYPHGTASTDYLMYTLPVAATSYLGDASHTVYVIRAQWGNASWANISSSNLSSTNFNTIPTPLSVPYYFNVSERIAEAPLVSGVGYYADYGISIDVPTYTKGNNVYSIAALDDNQEPIIHYGTVLTNSQNYVHQQGTTNLIQFNISLDWQGIREMTLYSSQDITVTTEFGDIIIFRLTRSG